MLAPQLKPTIDVDGLCFITSGAWCWYFYQSAILSYHARNIVRYYAGSCTVAHQGSCYMPGELWYMISTSHLNYSKSF